MKTHATKSRHVRKARFLREFDKKLQAGLSRKPLDVEKLKQANSYARVTSVSFVF